MNAECVRAYIEDELTPEQQAVCAQEGSFVVIACPGSGKTRTVGTRFAWRITDWQSRRVGVAAISFTNVAWKEIAEHLVLLGLRGMPQWPHFLGTIDSFVNQFIFLPFGHLAMGSQRRAEVAHPQSSLYTWVATHAHNRRFDQCYRKNCAPTLFEFEMDGSLRWCGGPRHRQPACARDHCTAVKNVMARAGYALPSDAMYYALRVLHDYPAICRAIASRFPEIIIDEAQDTSETQVGIIQSLAAAGCSIALVGDPEQSIYGFNGARPDLFLSFSEKLGWPNLPITANFRSSQLICNAADLFAAAHGGPARAIGVHRDCGIVPMVIKYAEGEESGLAPRFEALLSAHGLEVGGSAILAWPHDLIAKARGNTRREWPPRVSQMTKALARAATYRDYAPQFTAEAHRDAMWSLLSLCFDVGHYGFRYESIAPFSIRDWRRIGWRLLRSLPSSAVHLSTWGGEARHVVDRVIGDAGITPKKSPSACLQRFNDASAAKPVSEFVEVPGPRNGLTIKVIHQAKGETYDAVMVVAGRGSRNRGDHLSQWLGMAENVESDARGTGYVAVTRPQRLLVLAVPAETPDSVLAKLDRAFNIVT